jgi:hypothetical protein
LLLTAGCLLYLFFPLSPTATWDTSPDKKIIEMGFAGEVDYNHISDVQIWGDGYIVWVKYDVSGKRQVREGYLSKEEMTRLINQLIEAGFFGGYRRFNRFNLDVQWGNFLEVNLSNIDHLVTIDPRSGYNNQQVLGLVDFLRNGAGVTGTEFIPKNGTLLVYPIEELDKKEYPQNSKADYEWPDEEFGYSLETIYRNKPRNEREITGKELDFAWEIVNKPKPLVESKGKIYWIAVIVPKISL